ncbi:hypothetical protein ACFL4G_09460 [Thermodesulfobacteriota bacterium]
MKSMQKTKATLWTIGMALVFAFGSVIPVVNAVVPQEINYQGYLSDDTGTPIDGSVQMLFAIYDQETDGSELWSEGPMAVPVDEGRYSVILGETTPITPTLLDGPCWLEVIVEGEYLVPRERITSTPFTIEAEEADTVDGMEGAALEESAEIDADISAHAGDASVHHARYEDTEAVSACTSAGMEESAEIDTDIAAHAAVTDVHHAKTTSFTDLTDTATDAQVPDDITVNSAGDADTVDGQDASAFADAAHDHDDRYYTQTDIDALTSRIDALETLLANVTRVGNDISFNGVNVHINNGTGFTGGTNTLGNLIVGYNEPRGKGDVRSGSHNIVVGDKQNYSSYGGLVAGYENTISNFYASVSGGTQNVASGMLASVSGGSINVAGEYGSSVSGGGGNTASGWYSSISGGMLNTASGGRSSVSGGANNVASGDDSHVSGGGGATADEGNEAYANYSAILGGEANVAGDLSVPTNGQQSTVSGGRENTASGYGSSVSGGQDNTASGEDSSVSGGAQNTAEANNASVSGGGYNTASGTSASISGGQYNVASGDYSHVSGGGSNTLAKGNKAYSHTSSILGGSGNLTGDGVDPSNGTQSTISGGRFNTAKGWLSNISSGQYNVASGFYSHVSGGGGSTADDGNEAYAHYSAILGGGENVTGDLVDHAIGGYSTISGGRYNIASGGYSHVSGGGGDASTKGNAAYANYSSILGGETNWSGTDLDSTIAEGSTISGGLFNYVEGDWSSVSGGRQNIAADEGASVSGGRNNRANGDYSHVAGGGGPTWGDGVVADTDYLALLGNVGGDFTDAWSVNRILPGIVIPAGHNDGWETIAGLSKTFTLSNPALVLVTVNGEQRSWGSGEGMVGYRFVIDGVGLGDEGWGQRLNTTEAGIYEWDAWSLSDFAFLGSGQHTIEVQARANGSVASIAICGETNGSTPGYTSCNLQIEAFYE